MAVKQVITHCWNIVSNPDPPPNKKWESGEYSMSSTTTVEGGPDPILSWGISTLCYSCKQGHILSCHVSLQTLYIRWKVVQEGFHAKGGKEGNQSCGFEARKSLRLSSPFTNFKLIYHLSLHDYFKFSSSLLWQLNWAWNSEMCAVSVGKDKEFIFISSSCWLLTVHVWG